jgi:hypothetical protein
MGAGDTRGFAALAFIHQLFEVERDATDKELNFELRRRGRIYPTTLETGKDLQDGHETKRASTPRKRRNGTRRSRSKEAETVAWCRNGWKLQPWCRPPCDLTSSI